MRREEIMSARIKDKIAELTPAQNTLLELITDRYKRLCVTALADAAPDSELRLAFLICHKSIPLEFARLQDFDDMNFMHDVLGILRHTNTESGEVEDCFVPRCATRA